MSLEAGVGIRPHQFSSVAFGETSAVKLVVVMMLLAMPFRLGKCMQPVDMGAEANCSRYMLSTLECPIRLELATWRPAPSNTIRNVRCLTRHVVTWK